MEEKEYGHNNGGSTDYYKFKSCWKDCQDIIEDRKMNFAQGNIFKVAFCFNTGRHAASTYERDLNKIKWFADRELERIKTGLKMGDWWTRFIIYDGWNGCYIAWDETQANELGRFPTYNVAKEAILEHAKTLGKKETKRYPWVNIYVNNFGVEWGTKEAALENISEITNGKYVDTIQLKPKREEK